MSSKIISVKNCSHFFELGNNEFHGFQSIQLTRKNNLPPITQRTQWHKKVVYNGLMQHGI